MCQLTVGQCKITSAQRKLSHWPWKQSTFFKLVLNASLKDKLELRALDPRIGFKILPDLKSAFATSTWGPCSHQAEVKAFFLSKISTYYKVNKAKASCNPPSPQEHFLPVLLLLIEFRYNGKKSTDESVTGVVLVSLGSQKVASPFCISKFLLQLHILLAEKHQVLLQLGHLLCRGTQCYYKAETLHICALHLRVTSLYRCITHLLQSWGIPVNTSSTLLE